MADWLKFVFETDLPIVVSNFVGEWKLKLSTKKKKKFVAANALVASGIDGNILYT